MTLDQVLISAAERHPDNPAVVCKGRAVMYGEIRAELEALRRQHELAPGTRVAVLLVDSLPSCMLYIDLFVRGIIAIPVSVRATSAQIESMLSEARPHRVITNTGLYKRHRKVLDSYACLELRDTGGCSAAIVPINHGDDGDGRWTASTGNGTSNDVRTIMFTSGSTGKPKGVCLSESNVIAAATMMSEFLDLDAGRRTLVTPPMYDYYGYIQFFAHALRAGTCVIGESSAFPKSLFGAMTDTGATDLAVVPFSLKQLIEFDESAAHGLFRTIRRVTSSSDVLSFDLLERVFALNPDLIVHDIYGLTEAGRAASRRITRDSAASRSIGFPSAGVTFEVEGDRDEPGEIFIRGPNVGGFLQRIDGDDVDVFRPDRIATGDIGYREPTGEVILVGRKDHMLNMMGQKIHPSEIEAVVTRHAGIRDAMAKIISEGDGEPRVVLDVVCDGDDVEFGVLERALRKALPRAFVPAEIRNVACIPRTDVGAKIQRSAEAS